MPPTEKRNLGSYADKSLLEAIQLLISECFSAMNIANALGGSKTDEWRIIREHPIADIFGEAKKRNLLTAGIKAAVGDRTIENTWAKKYLES